MYKFLIQMRNDDDEPTWFYSYNSKMYPVFSKNVKEAILVGYRSRKQDRWITSGTSIHLVEDYKPVKKAFPDSEMCLIILSNNLDQIMRDSAYIQFYQAIAGEFV